MAALAALVIRLPAARAADPAPVALPGLTAPAATFPGSEPTAPVPAGSPVAPRGRPAPWKPPSLLAPLPGPPARAEAYELRRADDGTGDLLYRAPGFDARIHRDGSVRFTDRHFSLTLFPWLPYRTTAHGSTLQSLLRGALGKQDARGAGAGPSGASSGNVGPDDRTPTLAPTTTPFRPNPNEGCRYPAPCSFDASVVLVSVGGTFDLTDELMRLAGQDPYRYEKARFMKGTEELRMRLAARGHADDLRQASEHLSAHLTAIAADERLSLSERHAIIEALAQEMDPATAEGRNARATINEFLRQRFGATATPTTSGP